MASITLPRGFVQADTEDVRTWAAEVGLPFGGTRGRLPDATIDLFNQAHASGKGRMRYIGTDNTVREYVVRGPKGGIQKRVEAPSPVVRQWAALNGFTVSERGRLSAEVKEAYALANG